VEGEQSSSKKKKGGPKEKTTCGLKIRKMENPGTQRKKKEENCGRKIKAQNC